MRKALLAAATLMLMPQVSMAEPPVADISARSAEPPLATPVSPLPRVDLTIKDSDGLSHVIHVEVAADEQSQAYGLMNRKRLASDAGMLFWFGDSKPRWFWMKDTLIALDMLFVQYDGTIIHIHPNAQPLDESAVPSKGPVVAVIELNGGAAAGMGIKEGDKVFDSVYLNNMSATAKAVP